MTEPGHGLEMPRADLEPRAKKRTKTRAEMDAEATKVFELRLAGYRTDQIARDLGISVGTVVARAKRGGEMAVQPKVEEYREMVGSRLDATLNQLLAAVAKRGQGLSARDAEVIVKIEERRAKLFGLDAPVLIEQTVTHVDADGIDAEVRRLTEQLGLGDFPAEEPRGAESEPAS